MGPASAGSGDRRRAPERATVVLTSPSPPLIENCSPSTVGGARSPNGFDSIDRIVVMPGRAERAVRLRYRRLALISALALAWTLPIGLRAQPDTADVPAAANLSTTATIPAAAGDGTSASMAASPAAPAAHAAPAGPAAWSD
ncbi:MAG: hypothetical protein QM674_21490, partial [Burkholderiaceae bacterium]